MATKEDLKDLGILIKFVDKELSPVLNALKTAVRLQHELSAEPNKPVQSGGSGMPNIKVRNMSDEEVMEARNAAQKEKKEQAKRKVTKKKATK